MQCLGLAVFFTVIRSGTARIFGGGGVVPEPLREFLVRVYACKWLNW